MEADTIEKCLKEIFATETGKTALKILEEIYVRPSNFHTDSLVMSYLNGKKDLVQLLIDCASKDEASKPITVIEDED